MKQAKVDIKFDNETGIIEWLKKQSNRITNSSIQQFELCEKF